MFVKQACWWLFVVASERRWHRCDLVFSAAFLTNQPLHSAACRVPQFAGLKPALITGCRGTGPGIPEGQAPGSSSLGSTFPPSHPRAMCSLLHTQTRSQMVKKGTKN